MDKAEMACLISGLPDRDISKVHFWMTRKELDFWKESGVLSEDTEFGDMVFGATLTE